MLKRLLSVLLTITLVFGMTVAGFAASADIDIILDGKKISSQAYVNEEGKVMVPLRQLSEELGYTVEWNNAERSITLVKEPNTIELQTGEPSIIKNDENITMETSSVVKAGKTFVPLELFSKALNLVIGWENNQQILNISQITDNQEEIFKVSDYETITAKLHAYMKALEKKQNFNGSILVAKEGNVLLNEAYGLANFDQNTLNKTQTKFAIGSVTKQFTAMAIMQLSEKGLIDVNDTLDKYMPDFPNADLITIHNLLTHSSGLVNFTEVTEFFTGQMDNKSPMEILNLVKGEPLMFNPGDQFSYNNTNYLILGILVEELSNMSYEDYLQENIFDPINMKNTGLSYGKNNGLHDATAYTGYLEVVPIDDSILLRGAYGAGSIYSTTEDLYRWSEALKTEKLVKKATMDKIFTEYIDMEEAGSYGYGWMLLDSGVGKTIFHGGNTLGFTSNLVRFVDIDLTIIILTNVGYYDVNTLTNILTSISFGGEHEVPTALQEIELENTNLDLYVGNYELMPGVVYAITREQNKFFAQLTGQEKFEIFPYEEDKFFYKIVDANINFMRDDEGNVTNLVLYQMGQEILAVKIN